MSLLPVGPLGGAQLNQIANAIRLNGASSYLTRTNVASPTNANIWTLSVWIKEVILTPSTSQRILYITAGGGAGLAIYVGGNGLRLISDGSGLLTTTQVFRDFTGHFHFLFSYNSGAWTLEVNGVSVATGTNTIAGINAASTVQSFGGASSGDYLNGYFSNLCFVDGQALTSSSFGYTDINGQWRSNTKQQLQAVVASGNNSGLWTFEDGTSTTTLGYDYSGKSNNLSLTGLVRNGSWEDCWVYDTPTNNYPTMNPLAKSLNMGTIGNGALTNSTAVAEGNMYATMALPTSGKYYWEVLNTGGNLMFGLCNYLATDGYAWASGTAGIFYYTNGAIYLNGGVVASYSAAALGDVIGILADVDAGTVSFYKNGTLMGTRSRTCAGMLPAVSDGTSGAGYTYSINFGQIPVSGVGYDATAKGQFKYAVPSGAKALCTANIPDGTVTTSGTFTGNALADGPFVWCNGTPTGLTINGNAVTFGTHADKLAGGFKVKSAAAGYNASGSNTFSVTSNSGVFRYNDAEVNP